MDGPRLCETRARGVVAGSGAGLGRCGGVRAAGARGRARRLGSCRLRRAGDTAGAERDAIRTAAGVRVDAARRRLVHRRRRRRERRLRRALGRPRVDGARRAAAQRRGQRDRRAQRARSTSAGSSATRAATRTPTTSRSGTAAAGRPACTRAAARGPRLRARDRRLDALRRRHVPERRGHRVRPTSCSRATSAPARRGRPSAPGRRSSAAASTRSQPTAAGALYAGGAFSTSPASPPRTRSPTSTAAGWHALGSGPRARRRGARPARAQPRRPSGTDVYVGTDAVDIAGIPQADHVASWNGIALERTRRRTRRGGDGWLPARRLRQRAGRHRARASSPAAVRSNANGDPLGGQRRRVRRRARGAPSARTAAATGRSTATSPRSRRLSGHALRRRQLRERRRRPARALPRLLPARRRTARRRRAPPTTTTTTTGARGAGAPIPPPTGTPDRHRARQRPPVHGAACPVQRDGRRHARRLVLRTDTGTLDVRGARRRHRRLQAPARHRPAAADRRAAARRGNFGACPRRQDAAPCTPRRRRSCASLGRRQGPLPHEAAATRRPRSAARTG